MVAALGPLKWVIGKLRRRPRQAQSEEPKLPEDFATDGSDEPISANAVAPAAARKAAPRPAAPARPAPQAPPAHESHMPEAEPRLAPMLTLGHAYAAIIGLAIGLIVGGAILWKVASVQSKRLHRANAQIEEYADEIERLNEALGEANRKALAAPAPEQSAVKPAPAMRKETQVPGVDSNCDLSGDRAHMMDELRYCIQEFARRTK